MALLEKLVDQVSFDVRKKGVQCRATANIDFLTHDDQIIMAAVEGADETQEVTLVRDEPALLIEHRCTCPEFPVEGNGACQHIWATLLAAQRLGYLESWDMRGMISFEPAESGVELPADNEQMARAQMESPLEEYSPEDELTVALEPPPNFRDEEAEPMPRYDMDVEYSNPRFSPNHKGPQNKEKGWKAGLESLRRSIIQQDVGPQAWPANRQIVYVVDVTQTLDAKALQIELMIREMKKDGQWSKPRLEPLGSPDASRLPDVADAEIISMLGGAERRTSSYGYYQSYHDRASRYKVPDAQYAVLMRKICDTGRCFIRPQAQSDQLSALKWDDRVWELWLTAQRDDADKQFVLNGELRAGDERMNLADPLVMLSGGLLLTDNIVARLDHNNAFQWIILLRRSGSMKVPITAGEELVAQLFTMPQLPRMELPSELDVERVQIAPKPRLRVRKPPSRNSYAGAKNKLLGELSFEYDGEIVNATEKGQGIYKKGVRRLILRDIQAERTALYKLYGLGFREQRPSYYREDDSVGLELSPSHLPNVIRALIAENWHVEADGALYRQPGEFKMEVSSGIDWFELHGDIDFDGQSVALPELLRALRRGERTVRLGDGTFGVLPEQWLQKYGLLAGIGQEQDDHVRFTKTQVGLLDALLLAQPDVAVDEVFENARQRMRNFKGVRVADAPTTFVGELRPYQREGLGWLEFLREFGFGGCLADDMGLGKTVQVLALLEERRLLRLEADSKPKKAGANGDRSKPAQTPQDLPLGPSLVVAPRSLIFNWREEAKRFAPELRVLDHTGIGRLKDASTFSQYDLILTTYGTLRNDITFLKDFKFDYVVLDEAQAVKNSASESAKSVRLLGGTHRLALSGTPVQNHLGELWSLFEFLNPGMLGSARAFQVGGAGGRTVDEDARIILSRALRPFILRRTKAQVATELPQRLEQTIYCELDAAQRRQYDELKEHYRQSLLLKVAVEGINKNKIQVLEALLRLRQAACHPGLIDKSRVEQSSAKLDALLPQITEVIDGGHKALVFSQFTSLLSIVRSRLDKEKIPYVYLDGRTRDRQEVVNEFQTNDKVQLFLISLKAGGVGLNLTSAEYVFLLDPWWNPAVEAQAIDRAHRIGQTRQVFAYRLIAKDTVEEKVIQLQASKRELADAIINADNSVISKLGREDLEMLLS